MQERAYTEDEQGGENMILCSLYYQNVLDEGLSTRLSSALQRDFENFGTNMMTSFYRSET
jgi:hypothetical protein